MQVLRQQYHAHMRATTSPATFGYYSPQSAYPASCRSAIRTAAVNSLETCIEQQEEALVRTVSRTDWPQRSSMFLLRTDGRSCSRELVTGNGKLHFAYPTTQQHLLVWKTRPKSCMILMKLGKSLLSQFYEIAEFLGREEGLNVVVEPHVYRDFVHNREDLPFIHTYPPEDVSMLADYVDFVVCLGGDGVLLHASHLFKAHIPPVVSFHLGSMGFLTNHTFDDHRRDLRGIMYGATRLGECGLSSTDIDDGSTLGVMVTLRMRLRCEIYRRGSCAPEQEYEVLNEMVIDRGSSSFLTNIECFEQGRFITRVQADGIMLSTPTGSTAYSVSAGGSMVHPNVPAILLTPVCPHSLTFRPVILPDYADLELRVPDNARATAWVCFDGQSRQELHRGDSVRVRMSENPMPTINKTDLTGDWFESLQRCFKWSDRCVQKPFNTDGDDDE